MITKKNIISIFVLLLIVNFTIKAQVQNNPPMRQVIGTTGGTYQLPSGNRIDYTVGETMITTQVPSSPFTIKHLTQGFLQPGLRVDSLKFDVVTTPSTCKGAKNGTISIVVTRSTGMVSYTWFPPVSSTQKDVNNLAPGTYKFTVADAFFAKTDSVVITEDTAKCVTRLIFYSGITPNDDGDNDTWFISGLEEYPENSVYIYNRWGDIVWQAKNYDNVNVVWNGRNTAGEILPDATYFYLFQSGPKSMKGWIELTR